MNGIKKDRWTEDMVLALPLGEHDFFERKSGMLLNKSDYRNVIAKALSALANSGGGHLVLGVQNDGSIDGVQPHARHCWPHYINRLSAIPDSLWITDFLYEMISCA